MSLPPWASNSCFVDRRLPVGTKKTRCDDRAELPLPDSQRAELIPDRAEHTADHQVDREREERRTATNLVELIDRVLVHFTGVSHNFCAAK